ncbi:MAG: hypothetical protein EHM93_15575 [Bacteroidales bacterium]|nr:MAG: hypothetical protein EHM93_15575 [Bacteroidales bacterium]
MNDFNRIVEFLKTLIFNTFGQLIWLLGLLFVFGFFLYFLARFTRTTYVKTTGSTLDIFVTGWIGTPIHELGHAIFCLLFRHQITEIKLYSPNSTDGTLGYINHAFDPKSIFQKIGNFFIGIGPIIFGTAVIYALLHFLVPNTREVFSSIDAQSKVLMKSVHGEFSGILNSLWDTTYSTLGTLFKMSNLNEYKFWIFLYLSMCISSHMELSPPDIKGAWKGLVSLTLFFLIINLIILSLEATGVSSHLGSWWHYIKLESHTAVINKWVGAFGALFIFSSIISGLNLLVTYIGLNIYSSIKGKGMVNPFW